MHSPPRCRTLPDRPPKVVGIMARNHRGFVEALIAANRIGADVLLLNTSFAGPALAEVVQRENVDAVIYDEEFTDDRRPRAGRQTRRDADRRVDRRATGWADGREDDRRARRQQPQRASTKGKVILLTSGTTGTPKGAKHSGGRGGPGILKAILDRTPWRTEETVVMVAPMFHAWGFSQLVFAASMACTVVTRRKFDPEATLELVDRHRATGLCVVPVMFDRIMDLPDEVRRSTAAGRCGSPPRRVHGCAPTSSSSSWTSSATSSTTTTTPPRPA